jgi:hypothetical protein
MQQSCTYGSVRGASGNRRPYRDKRALQDLKHSQAEARATSYQQLGRIGGTGFSLLKPFSASC